MAELLLFNGNIFLFEGELLLEINTDDTSWLRQEPGLDGAAASAGVGSSRMTKQGEIKSRRAALIEVINLLQGLGV